MKTKRSRLSQALMLVAACCLLSGSSISAEDKPAANKSSLDASSRPDDGTVQMSKKPRVRLGGITVGVGYSHMTGPYYSPYYFPYRHYGYFPYYGSWWDPFWGYSPYGFYPYPSFYPSSTGGPGMGEVKIQTQEKSAEVYVNGALAGAAQDLKSFWLASGVYDLELRTGNQQAYKKRIYILSGKSVKISPTFSAEEKEAKQ